VRKWLPILILLVGCDGGSSTTPTSDCIATVTWEVPTQRMDGTPILIADISKITIYMSEAPFTDDMYKELEVQILNPMLITWEIKNVDIGEHWFYLTITDTEDNTSAYSNILGKIC